MNEYFRELRILSQKIDSDIKNLEKTWESPHLLIGGYGDNVEEAEPYLEHLLGDIKDLQDQLIADQEPRAKYLADTKKDVKAVETFYEQLKQDCEDVETLLSDWGYKPVIDNFQCSLPTDESELDSSILTPEQMADTPSPCTNYSERSKIDMIFTSTLNMDGPKSIATPVIKSLASVKLELESRSKITSSLDRPSKDFLSPYYGRRMK